MAFRLQIRDLPTLDEWLEGPSRLTPVALFAPASEAIREAREAEDGALIDALGWP
jgi:hypothetical protein